MRDRELKDLAKYFQNISHRKTAAGEEVCGIYYDRSSDSLKCNEGKYAERFLVSFNLETNLPFPEVVDNRIRYDIILRRAIEHRVIEVLDFIKKSKSKKIAAKIN